MRWVFSFFLNESIEEDSLIWSGNWFQRRGAATENDLAQQQKMIWRCNRKWSGAATGNDLALQQKMIWRCNRKWSGAATENDLALQQKMIWRCNRKWSGAATENDLALQQKMIWRCNRKWSGAATENDLVLQQKMICHPMYGMILVHIKEVYNRNEDFEEEHMISASQICTLEHNRYNNNIIIIIYCFIVRYHLAQCLFHPTLTLFIGHWALTFLKLSQLPGELTSPLWLPIRRSGSIHNNHNCPRRYSFTAEWTEAIGNEVSCLRTQHGAQSGNWTRYPSSTSPML